MQVFQAVHNGQLAYPVLFPIQPGGDLRGGEAFVPQVGGQPHQQVLAHGSVQAVHHMNAGVLHGVGGHAGALVGAGELAGDENGHHLVACIPGALECGEHVAQVGLAGLGQLFAGGQLFVKFFGLQIHPVPISHAVLKGHAQRQHLHVQLAGKLFRQICGRVGQNTHHNQGSPLLWGR